MNDDLRRMLQSDAALGPVVDRLRAVAARRVSAGFTARVMAEVHAASRRSYLSAAGLFSAAAALVALLAVASLFTRPKPRAFAWRDWAHPPCVVRLPPYDPAAWYPPMPEWSARAGTPSREPLCTRSAGEALRGVARVDW